MILIFYQTNTAVIDQICKSFYEAMSKDFVQAGMNLARIITGIGVFMSLYFRYSDFLFGKGKFDSTLWVKPMILATAISVYPTIFAGFEKSFFAMDKKSAELSVKIRDKVDAKLIAKTAAEAKKEKKEQDEILSNSDDNSAWYLSAYESISDSIGAYFDELVLLIARIIYYAVYCLLKITSLIYVLFIGMFGSIIIAMSLFKWFEGGFPTWIARLVTTLMWMPILNIVSYAVSTIQLVMVQNDIDAINASQTNFKEDSFGILFYVIATGMYWQVPKIAGFLMESAGVGSGGLGMFGNLAQNVGSSASSGVGGAMGAVTGGAWSGVKSVGNAAQNMAAKGFNMLKSRFNAK